MKNDLAERREQFFPKNIISHHTENFESWFVFENDVQLHVSVISDTIIRFRYATEEGFNKDFSYAINKVKLKKNINFYEFKESEHFFSISTAKLIVTVQKSDGIKKITNRSGEILKEDEKGFHWEYDRVSGNDIVMMSHRIQSSEYFYGLGDKSGNMNLRGRKLQHWGSDTYAYDNESDPLYKNIPFFMSLHKEVAYGIFFDNTFRSHFDFGKERGNVYSFWAQGGEMNYYFIYGPELMTVSEQYALLTGTPELPPLWALGFHQCKWSYYPEKKISEITTEFRKRKIPCDAIYLDIDYMDGFRCFTWNNEHFPDPSKMIQDLKKQGFKTIVIIDPGIKIDKEYWVYNEGRINNYFCRRADGKLMKGSVWPGLCNFPDFTKPSVREWWAGLFNGLIAENGVSGVWNDMNEPAVFEDGTFPDDVRFNYDGNPCSHLKAHNVYGMMMAKATYEGVKRFGYPNRPFVITRSGYSGVQKYSSVWTGDNVASWEHLQIANTQCQRLSISGVSFTGSDIGGFIESPSPELFARWIQLGVFHPFCRVHSSGDHGDQEPWSFGTEVTTIVKKFIELRYQLLPYLYTSFWQYASNGTPMLRPLAFLDQANPETYYRQDEFGLGDNLLICPMTQEKEEGRWMYLPKGIWYNFWDDKKYDGREEIWVEAKLDSTPVFIKGGSLLPMYPIQQFVGEKNIETLFLHLYYTDNQEISFLYEDAGNGYDYTEKDEFNVAKFTFNKIANTSILTQEVERKFKPQYTKYELILHGFKDVKSLKCDRKTYELIPNYQNGKSTLSFLLDIDFKEIFIS
jgi:alpha-glucosidase